MSLLALLLGGCSHRVLTFFFTGVPDPNAPRPVETIPDESQSESLATARPVGIPEQTNYQHGPWAARRCESCHRGSGGNRFNDLEKENSTVRTFSSDPQRLCITCHNQVQFRPDDTGLWVHGPVATGSCINCHSPHYSRRPYMLLGDSNNDLCGSCHNDRNLNNTGHPPTINADCVDCHDPHTSSYPLLLRAGRAQ